MQKPKGLTVVISRRGRVGTGKDGGGVWRTKKLALDQEDALEKKGGGGELARKTLREKHKLGGRAFKS